MAWARRLICVAVVASLLVAAGGVASVAAAAYEKEVAFKPQGKGVSVGWAKKVFIDEDDAPWATGYMAKMKVRGLMQGYPGGKFLPNAAVSRVELVVLAVRLKGLEQEARDRSGAVLPFSDAEQIYRKNAWAVGYLATAISAGLISSTRAAFQAEKAATRLWASEVFIKAMGLEQEANDMMNTSLPYSDAHEIPSDKVGYVAVALERGIMMGYGNAFRPNAPIKRSEIAAVLDRADEALPPKIGYEVRGIITGVNEQNPAITVRVLDNRWWDWKVMTRNAYKGNLFTGTVTIPVSEDALILVNKKLGDLSDLETGQRALILRNSDGKAILIDANGNGPTPNWPDVGSISKEGTVRAIDLGSPNKVTIRDNQGIDWTYQIASNCQFLRDGDEIDLDDVRVGDRVTIKIVDSKITKLVVEAPVADSVKTGEVTDIRAGSTPRITIELSDDSSFTAAISSSVVVKEDGSTRYLSDVHVGDDVRIELRDGYVVRIDILESEAREYTGVVQDVYFSGSPKRLTIRLDGTRTMSATLSDSVVVKYDGHTVSLSEVKVGDTVDLTVVNSLVTKIDIERRSVTEREGTVTQVETGSGARIWIRVSGGSIVNYQVTSSATVEFHDDDDLELEDVVPGDKVDLRISDSKVTRIVIEERPVSEIQGTVTALNPSSTSGRTVTVRDSAGNLMTYKVWNEASIKKGSDTLRFSDLDEGDSVILKVEGNLVTRITVL
ncbi:MAG: S-layer homology domain-containing protein [Firmicutes bacterium]|nr:S-layer homology domain-containing protein [Bacillota bacterium]